MTFFGIQLHPQYTTWDEMRDAALLAEQAGWDVLMTWDHFVPLMGDVTGPNLEGWQILPAFAAITTKPLIGMLVTGNTYRHPAVLANMASTLDNISHGRAVLGIGAAWQEHEHNMYGIDFGTPAIRLAKLRESARIQRVLLDEGKITFHGKHYDLENATLGTRPIQKRVPILIGGGGEQVTLKITARYADWWHSFGTAEIIKHKMSGATSTTSRRPPVAGSSSAMTRTRSTSACARSRSGTRSKRPTVRPSVESPRTSRSCCSTITRSGSRGSSSGCHRRSTGRRSNGR